MNGASEIVALSAGAVIVLALDLALFHRRPRRIGLTEAAISAFFFVALATAFAYWMAHAHGRASALEFTAAYVTELSLSIDNLFLFLLIFRYFKIPPERQHRVLFWGIVGALVARGLFILAGVELLQRFVWVSYGLGAFLMISGLLLLVRGEREVHPEKNPVLALLRRFLPIEAGSNEDKLLLLREGRWFGTPLLVALIAAETTDILFATDSIPAVLAITRDAVIVYAANVFAVFGLRSLYFLVSELMQRFRTLHYGIALILLFVGVKMAFAAWLSIPTETMLAVIAALVLFSIVASFILPAPAKPAS